MEGLCRKLFAGLRRPELRTQSCRQRSKLSKHGKATFAELSLSDHVSCFASARGAAAEWKALKPGIGIVIRLMKR